MTGHDVELRIEGIIANDPEEAVENFMAMLNTPGTHWYFKVEDDEAEYTVKVTTGVFTVLGDTKKKE